MSGLDPSWRSNLGSKCCPDRRTDCEPGSACVLRRRPIRGDTSKSIHRAFRGQYRICDHRSLFQPRPETSSRPIWPDRFAPCEDPAQTSVPILSDYGNERNSLRAKLWHVDRDCQPTDRRIAARLDAALARVHLPASQQPSIALVESTYHPNAVCD